MALLQTAFDYGRLERPTLQQARRALAQHYQARLEVGERLQPYMVEYRAPCTRPAGGWCRAGRQAGRIGVARSVMRGDLTLIRACG
jgi:hypothetical protein